MKAKRILMAMAIFVLFAVSAGCHHFWWHHGHGHGYRGHGYHHYPHDYHHYR